MTQRIKPSVRDIVDDIADAIGDYHDGRGGWEGISYNKVSKILTIEFESDGLPEYGDGWGSVRYNFKFVEDD